MAEPVGITASIVTLMQLSTAVIEYLTCAKDASKERTRLLLELSSTIGILHMIKNLTARAEAGEAYLDTVKWLEVPDGPLDQFKSALERLAKRLKSAVGLRAVKRALVWPFTKEEVVDIVHSIERLKTIFALALENDHRELSRVIKSDVAGIRTLQNDQQELSRAIKNEIAGVRAQQLSAQADSRRETALRWLEKVDPSTNHNAACKKHEPTTGGWFLRSEHFEGWKCSPNSILWLYGIPGCGKTVLSSTVIEDMKSFRNGGSKNRLAYFYFDFNDREKQLVTNLLRSIIAQISREGSTLPTAVEELFSRHKEQSQQPSRDTLMRTLLSVLRDDKDYYIIIDALDECAEREILLDTLSELAGHGMKNLHTLLTSRHEQDIKGELEPIVSKTVHIQNDMVDEDIRLHVRKCLEIDRKLKKWPDSIKGEIETSLVEGAHGMFRWVFCQLEALRRCLTTPTLRQSLRQLPKTLDETYDRILCSIPDEHFEQAYALLQWLALSERPLSLKEAAEAAIMNSETCGLMVSGSADWTQYRLLDPEAVLGICGSLVTCRTISFVDYEEEGADRDNQKEELRFAHYSVKEYVTSERIRNGRASRFSISDTTGHIKIGNYCLSYLLQFNELELLSSEVLEQYPLLYYSAKEWHKHVKKIEDGSLDVAETISLVLKLLDSSEGVSFINWVRIGNPNPFDPLFAGHLQRSEVSPPLYYAAIVGLVSATDILLEKGADVDVQGGYFGNALQAASSWGHEAVVRLLLEKGADVNAQGGYFGNALQAASFEGHEAIFRLLLGKGAAVNAQGGYFGNALHAASFEGHEAIVRLLLEKGADVNAQGGYFGNALQAASSWGHEAIVRLLLEKGAEVDAQGGCFGNALQAASSWGHEAIVRLLLEKGADVNAQGGEYGNALQAASSWGHEAIVRLLLENGAEVNTQGGRHDNALQAASYRGHEAVAGLLLERGADPSTIYTWKKKLGDDS